MKEIKFACPQCSQHIACDPDYAGMCIVCPACNQPMEVPRLSPSGDSHADRCIVASIPTPKRRSGYRIPTIDYWTEEEWEEHCRETPRRPEELPGWLVSALGTLIAAALLKAGGAPGWAVVLCVLVGTALSSYLLAKRRRVANSSPGLSTGTGVTSLLLSIGLLIVAIPVVAVGVLFIGCVCAA